ncbi:MAG: GntR family transcriptional regulator [Pseudomonadota bacterium]
MATIINTDETDVSKLPALSDLTGSLADRVYSAVKTAILNLDFLPGAAIRKSAICDQLGVSRSPVSDALAKLSSEGLVDIVPQSGTRVARLSMAAIREDVFFRAALEGAAARHAATHRSEEILARLLRNLEMQRLLVADADGEDFFRTDIAMHEMILGTTGVQRLPGTVRTLSSHVDRARVMLVPEPGRMSETVDEHVDVIEAIKNQNATGAEEAMRHHIRQLIKRLAPLEAARPDLFDG